MKRWPMNYGYDVFESPGIPEFVLAVDEIVAPS
jgi:hypothetical protein